MRTEKGLIYNFTSENNINNRAWIIGYDHIINNIFRNIDSLYIVAGYHRAASAVKVVLKRRI